MSRFNCFSNFKPAVNRILLRAVLSGLFLVSLFSSSQSAASFDENTHRYLTGPELFWALDRVLPRGEYGSSLLENDCHILNDLNAADLGVASPALGEPLSPNPHSGTVQWVQSCVGLYFQADLLRTVDWKILLDFFGKAFWQSLRSDSRFASFFKYEDRWPMIHPDLDMKLRSMVWSDFSPEEQRFLIQGLIRSVLGPDEMIADFGFVTTESLTSNFMKRTEDLKTLKVYEVIQVLVTNLVLREEFLSY